MVTLRDHEVALESCDWPGVTSRIKDAAIAEPLDAGWLAQGAIEQRIGHLGKPRCAAICERVVNSQQHSISQ